MKTTLVTALLLIGAALAYESYIPNARHPDHPDKCYYKESDHLFGVGEVHRPVNGVDCQKLTCQEDNVIRVNVCQKYSVPPDCVEGKGNLSQPFPTCCNFLLCTVSGKEEVRQTGFD